MVRSSAEIKFRDKPNLLKKMERPAKRKRNKTSDIISSDVDLILQKFNNVPDLFVKLPIGYLALKLVKCLLSQLPGKVIVFGLSKELCTRIIIENSDNVRIIQPGKLVRNSQYSTVKQLLCPDIIYLKEDFELIKKRIVIICELSDICWSKEIDLLPKRLILNQNPASLKLRNHFRHLIQVKWPNGLRPLKRKNFVVDQAPELSKIQSDLKSNYPNAEIETDLVNFIKGRVLAHESMTDSLRQLFSHFDKFKYISSLLHEIDNRDQSRKIVFISKWKLSKEEVNFGNLKNIEIFTTNESGMELELILEDLQPDYIILTYCDFDTIRMVELYKNYKDQTSITLFTFCYDNSFDEQLFAIQTRFEHEIEAQFETDSSSSSSKTSLIVFDLETTGMAPACDIVEIACWKMETGWANIPDYYDEKMSKRDDVFYSLILPTKRMNPRAAKCNGIKKAGKKNLLVRGVKHFNVKEPKAVFKEFIVWLQKFENPILIGHNGFRFDAPVIIRSMIRFGLFGDFKNACNLFGDTLVPMKSYFGSESCKLTKLGANYIPNWTRYKEKAHSALFDVWATIQILKIKRLEFKNSSFKPIGDLIPTRTDPNKVAQTLEGDFFEMVSSGIIKSSECQLILGAGISYKQLEEASLHSQKRLQDLLEIIFTEKSLLCQKVAKIRYFFVE